MTRNRLRWLVAGLGLALAAAVSAPSFPAEAEKAGAATPSGPSDKEKQQIVETILRQQEELLTGERFTYDPAGRRDPFRSLFEQVGVQKKGPRPKGIAGMLVSEVDLVGIAEDPSGGNIAVVIGSDNKGYFLRVADEVYDGVVIAVDPRAGTVTFRQQVDDPRLIKPYRDVVKRLVPVEEEKGP